MIKQNLGIVMVAIGILFVLALIALLTLFDKPVDAFVGSITTILTVAAGFGLLGSQVTKIGKNVNGNQTRLLNDNERLRGIIEANGLSTESTPVQATGFAATEPLASEETIQRIKRDRDSLPTHRATDE